MSWRATWAAVRWGRPAQPHEPTRTRVMPKEYYGAFDVRQTEDGSRAYILPHSIHFTIMHHLTKLHPMMVLATISLLLFLFYARPFVSREAWHYFTQLERLPLAASILFLPVFAVAYEALSIIFGMNGYRVISIITIRENGMILDNKWFYPCAHIWDVKYCEQTDEGFKWIVEIQLGVHKVRLANDLDEPAARLFTGLFAADIRRYWHRQNA